MLKRPANDALEVAQKRKAYSVDVGAAVQVVVEYCIVAGSDLSAEAPPYRLSLKDVLRLSTTCREFRSRLYHGHLVMIEGFLRPVAALNTEQMRVADLVLRKKQSVCIVGGGGCGKTTTFKAIISELEERDVSFVRCAPTGVAASHIGGVTIHQLFGFKPVGDELRVKNSWMMRAQLALARVVLIDEMSMISADLFRQMNQRLCELHRHETSARGKPFGGVQLVMCGDPFQLPPITKEFDAVRGQDQQQQQQQQQRRASLTTSKIEVSYMTTLFHSVFGENDGVVFLYRSMRQQNDDKFTALLHDVRIGNYSIAAMAALRDRLISVERAMQMRDTHTFLFCKRDRVAAHNAERLAALPGLPVTWTAIDRYAVDLVGNGEERERLLEGNTTLEPVLTLKVGAKVLLTVNADVTRGLVNGSRGRVVELKTACELGLGRCPPEHACATCSTRNWHVPSRPLYKVMASTWTRQRAAAIGPEVSRFSILPVVKFDNCSELLVVRPHFFEIQKGRGKRARRKKIPAAVESVLDRCAGHIRDAVMDGDICYRVVDGVPRCIHRKRFEVQCPTCIDMGTIAPGQVAGECAHQWPLAEQCEICHAVARVSAENAAPSDEVIAMRIQLPLRQADALTVHRAQGMTLANVCFGDPYSMFQPGQGYVVLSRVPTLTSLFIIGDMIPSDRMQPPPQAVQFYKLYGGTLGDGLAVLEGRQRIAKMDAVDWG